MKATLTLAIIGMAMTACGSSSFNSTAANSHPASPGAAVSPSPSPTQAGPAPTFSTLDVTGQPAPAGASLVLMKNQVYSPTSITVSGGSFSLLLQNQEVDADLSTCHPNERIGWCRHDLQIRTGSPQGPVIGQSEIVDIGKSALFTVQNLPRGRYLFVCSVYNHWYESGMKGLLTVQ